MQPNKYLKTLLILLLISISGCSIFKPKPEIVTKIVDRQIQIPERPKPVILNDVKFYVVVEENYEEFKQRFMKENSEYVVIAISVQGYENMALNISEMKRYIQQQKEIIIYYEEALKPKEKGE